MAARISTGVAFAANVATPDDGRRDGRAALDRESQGARRGRGDVDAGRGHREELHPRALAPRPRRGHAEAARHDARAGDERVSLALRHLDPRPEPGDDARFARGHDRVDADELPRLDDHLLARPHVGGGEVDRVVAVNGAHPHVEGALDPVARAWTRTRARRESGLDGDGDRASEAREHGDGHGPRVRHGLRPAGRRDGAARRREDDETGAGRTDRARTRWTRTASATQANTTRGTRATSATAPSKPMAGANTPATMPRPSMTAVAPSERRSTAGTGIDRTRRGSGGSSATTTDRRAGSATIAGERGSPATEREGADSADAEGERAVSGAASAPKDGSVGRETAPPGGGGVARPLGGAAIASGGGGVAPCARAASPLFGRAAARA